jgi:hypothetical protein
VTAITAVLRHGFYNEVECRPIRARVRHSGRGLAKGESHETYGTENGFFAQEHPSGNGFFRRIKIGRSLREIDCATLFVQCAGVHVNGSDSYHMLPAQAFRIAVTNGSASSDGLSGLLETLMNGLPNEVPLLHGNVWEVIADVISRNKIDLVVLGTHGRSGLPKLIWGSVAEQIFRNVWCPVMTLGPSVEPIKEEICFQKICSPAILILILRRRFTRVGFVTSLGEHLRRCTCT